MTKTIFAADFRRMSRIEITDLERDMRRALAGKGYSPAEYSLEARHAHDAVELIARLIDPLTAPLSFDDRGIA